MAQLTPKQVYQRLDRHYGPQHWWPADSSFEVMVGSILTQNTAWSNVERAIDNLKACAMLDAEAIAEAAPDKLASCLKPSGYFNIKARRLRNFCEWYLAQGGFKALKRVDTDELRRALLAINGVGPETADDMLLYAFERPVFVIDAYTRRLFSRLGLIAGAESYESLRAWFESRLGAETTAVPIYNQYHALIVVHAKEACRKRPLCGHCCLKRHCPGQVE